MLAKKVPMVVKALNEDKIKITDHHRNIFQETSIQILSGCHSNKGN